MTLLVDCLPCLKLEPCGLLLDEKSALGLNNCPAKSRACCVWVNPSVEESTLRLETKGFGFRRLSSRKRSGSALLAKLESCLSHTARTCLLAEALLPVVF